MDGKKQRRKPENAAEWFKQRQEEWVKEAQALLVNLRKKIGRHRAKLSQTDDTARQAWHRDRIKDHEERIAVVRRQHQRLSRFMKKYKIDLPALDFGE